MVNLARLLSILLIAQSIIFPARASEKISNNLYEIMAYAYKHNPSLQAARAEFSAVQEQLPQALAGLQPTISANANVELTDTETEGQSFVSADGRNVSKSASIDLNQPIFTGGTTIANIKQAKHVVQAQSYVLSALEQQLLFNVASVFMDVHEARTVLDLNRNNYTLLNKELERASLRYEVGELTKTDVAQVEAELAQADAAMILAEGQLKTMLARYRQLVGINAPSNIQYPTLPFILPQTLSEAQELAASNNRSILQAKSVRASTEKGADSILGELLPQISANGQFSKSFNPNDFVDEQEQGRLALVATIPLYQGGAVHSRYREAKKQMMRRTLEIKDVENQVQQNVIRIWEELNAAKAELIARQRQLDAGQLAFEGVQHELEYGQRTTLDVLDANQDVLDAQVALTQAGRDKIVAQFALAEILGVLVPQNLGFRTINP